MSDVFSIELSDGTILSRLRLNGTNYVAEYPVDLNTFKGRTSIVRITDGESTTVLENVVVQITEEDIEDEWWFVLSTIGQEEMRLRLIESNTEYLAMMMDVEL